MGYEITKEDLEKLAKKKGYKGCKNCARRDEKGNCVYKQSGGDKDLHFFCPDWLKETNIWQEVHEGLFTPGGDPVWECPRCKFRHCYGVEAVEGPYDKCPKCGKKVKYPWMK